MSQKVQKPPSVEVSQSNVITPLVFIKQALDSGTPVDEIAKLWDLQQSFMAVESKKSFDIAMVGFRSECPPITKNKSVSFGNTAYDFAALDHAIEIIKPVLQKFGLNYRWEDDQIADQIIVKCIVTHIDGHSAETRLSAPPDESGKKNRVQAIAATKSYLNRYTLFSCLGLAATDEDTDAIVDDTPEDHTLPDFITAAEAAHLEKLANQVEANKKTFLAYLKVESFAQIPADQYSAAEAALKKKGAAK